MDQDVVLKAGIGKSVCKISQEFPGSFQISLPLPLHKYFSVRALTAGLQHIFRGERMVGSSYHRLKGAELVFGVAVAGTKHRNMEKWVDPCGRWQFQLISHGTNASEDSEGTIVPAGQFLVPPAVDSVLSVGL
ncbi:hypothetical protein Salat_2424000 [Sesamum alatum]|uniref:Uncharacterized protein n=1 Tax=Sesamum alatum TaxID=300844 RepID=A0AAE2CFD2_9LAMI|nr:hypothetical protein Salat_2424000 [Sesamum alatum]